MSTATISEDALPFFGLDPDERRQRERFGRKGGPMGALPAQQPMPTPCSVAWQSAAHRAKVRTWLESWPDGKGELLLPVTMPDKTERNAVFLRRVVTVGREMAVVALDGLRSTVYTGLSKSA